jgi:hypothetical protein
MRASLIAATAALTLAGGTAIAQDRDTPPPGCRWMGDDLGCKDGRGHYRRAGDGEIIGTYPISKPKPKPAPQPQPAPLPTETPPAGRDIAAAPAEEAGVDGADNPFPLNDAGAQPPAESRAPEPAIAPLSRPGSPAAQTAPAQPKLWWQTLLDWIADQFRDLMKLLGLAK